MNAQAEIQAVHTSIAAALATAQKQMGKVAKNQKTQNSNDKFNYTYADLASVMDACLPALNDVGIAVIQPTTRDEHGPCVKTVLIHGDTGETLECSVPLIVAKNDMQGYGSAVTYARRYGLMAMAGIAPEDDDGSAASKAPPSVSPEQFIRLRDLLAEADADPAKFLAAYSAASLEQFPQMKFADAVMKLRKKIDAKPADLGGDEIPYTGPNQ